MFIWCDSLLWCCAAWGDRLCIPDYAEMRLTVLEELHTIPLGWHFGLECTLSLAQHSIWWPLMWLPLFRRVLRVSMSRCPLDSLCLWNMAWNMACPLDSLSVEHGLPPGLTVPLPVPAHSGGTISLDFMELPRSLSWRDFLQVQIDLLTGLVWLVPTVKTCTS